MDKNINLSEFSLDEYETLLSILVERSTYYANEVFEFKMKALKSTDENIAIEFLNQSDFCRNRMNVLNKFLRAIK